MLIPLDEKIIDSLEALYEEGRAFVEGRVYSYAAGFVAAQQMGKFPPMK